MAKTTTAEETAPARAVDHSWGPQTGALGTVPQGLDSKKVAVRVQGAGSIPVSRKTGAQLVEQMARWKKVLKEGTELSDTDRVHEDREYWKRKNEDLPRTKFKTNQRSRHKGGHKGDDGESEGSSGGPTDAKVEGPA